MDLTPSGKPKLGYSYPSGQRRQGPAPLASFEDLPSDEQISPEADGDDNTLQDLSPGPEEFDHILSFDSRDVLTQPSPHKFGGPKGVNGNQEGIQNSTNGMSVMQSTIAINSDNTLLSPTSGQGWSSQTVTPLTFHHTSGEEQSSASGEVTPTGYSSPTIPYAYELTSNKCRDNLTVPSGDESGGEKSPSPDSRRKGSWTDIFFRGRSRSRSKSPIGSECSQKSPGFEQEPVPVEKAKNKKGFFSFLKVGRKSSTSSGTANGPSQAQSSSSSTANQPNNSVSTPSQENESISFNERNGQNANNYASNYTSLNESNNKSKENWTNSSTTKSSKSEKCDYAPSQPMVSGGNAELGKLRDELTVIQDLNEPKESQQDIINIIEREIEQKMSALNEDIHLDLPPDLQFDELLLSSKANILSTNQQSEIESSSNIASDDPTNNNNPLPQPNLTRKLKTRTDTIDDECQSLPRSFKTKDHDSTVNRPTETVIATIEHNSSEKGYSSGSDLEESSATLNAEAGKKASYLKRQSSETSEIDFEAATLLTHDSIDYEDYDGPTELILSPDAEDKMNRESCSRASSRRRLDVNTIPIDRPRSATPINIAPLEAFLNTASPSPDPNVEKIRLSLPGDTFTNCTRAKSPRKSNPAIWLEFCEKGLHSPKSFNRRRRSTLDKDISPRDSLPSGGLGIKNQTNDAFTPVTESPSQAVSPLTPITPLDFEDQWTPFGDNFNPYAFIKENLEHQVERYKWSMECDKCDCLIGKLGNINSNDPSGCNTPAEGQLTPLSPREIGESGDEQPLVSPIACSCDCHHNISIIRSNSNQVKQEGLYSISSDISSASSRLIQASSASSSKSSSVGEVEDKVLS